MMQTLGDSFPKNKCKKCGKPIEARFEYCFEHKDEGRNTRGQRGSAAPPRAGAAPRFRSSPSVYPPPATSFEEYLESLHTAGYFAAADPPVIREELLTEHARVVALRLVEANISTSQLRRFFDMARGLEQQYSDHANFALVKSELARLPAHAANLVGRESNGQQREKLEDLHRFLVFNAAQAGASPDTFKKGFLKHFESVLAYFTYYKTTKKR